MENISEGQWLVSGMSEGEVRAPLLLNGGKHCPSHFWHLILKEYFSNFFYNFPCYLTVGLPMRPSGVGSEPDDTLYETDDLDQVSVNFVLLVTLRHLQPNETYLDCLLWLNNCCMSVSSMQHSFKNLHNPLSSTSLFLIKLTRGRGLQAMSLDVNETVGGNRLCLSRLQFGGSGARIISVIFKNLVLVFLNEWWFVAHDILSSAMLAISARSWVCDNNCVIHGDIAKVTHFGSAMWSEVRNLY